METWVFHWTLVEWAMAIPGLVLRRTSILNGARWSFWGGSWVGRVGRAEVVMARNEASNGKNIEARICMFKESGFENENVSEKSNNV